MPTQKNDIFNPGAAAITYSGAGQKWTIGGNADVGSASSFAIVSAFANSKLVNEGYLYSYANVAANFIGNNTTVINKASGVINGFSAGVFINTPGTDASLTNDGKILSAAYGVGVLGPGDLEVENHGEIFGHTYGLYVSVGNVGSTAGPKIVNDGSIRSDSDGLVLIAANGLRSTVTNGPGGVIQGDLFAIVVSNGALKLTNDGKIKGDVVSTSGNDTIVNGGQIKGEVILGSGNDTFKNAGGTAGQVHGGNGNDTLIAGPHKDQFVFDATLNPATNVDRVKHFDPGTDKLILNQTFFPALSGLGTLASAEFHKGTGAHDLDDRIIYNKATGALLYDPNGSVPGGEVQFAKLDKGLNLHASDFTVIA